MISFISRPVEQFRYITFCTEAHMRSMYPDAEVLPPIRPERQNCCVIRKAAAPGR